MSENVNLNDIGGGTLPRRSTTYFDLTAGNGNTGMKVEDTAETPARRQAVPVQAGPINMENVRPVDINTILPKRAPEPNEMEASLYADLDAAVDREIASITERHDALFEAQQQEMENIEAAQEEEELKTQDAFALNGYKADEYVDEFDGLLYDDDDEDDVLPIHHGNTNPNHPVTVNHFINPTNEQEATNNSVAAEPVYTVNTDNEGIGVTVTDGAVSTKTIVEKPKHEEVNESHDTHVNILDGIKNEDLFDDEEEEVNFNPNEGPSSQEILDDLKSQIKEKVSPIRKTIDLSKFTFAKKAVSAQKVMKLAIQNNQNAADWVLPSAGRSISMTGLSGSEILKLNPENSNRNRANTFRDMYRIMYDHVLDGNKPEFEAWLKQLRYVDLQHVYFALYMATFGGSNFINYSCPKCKKVFIKDISFKDMVVYADDETKTKIQNLLKMDTTSPSKDEYPVTLIPVSDSYAFAIKTPSVWNVIMETASLSDKFLEKHADLIDVVSYIDSAYLIDNANSQLIPINTKPDPNDMAKTAARRIKAMYDIISTLSSEEYYALRAAIGELDEEVTKLSYQIPACTCPACATEIPANTEVTPDGMLFMRHQLAAIGNM